MNYLQLIIQFWKQRRKKRLTNLQADLYMFLIQECNEQDWENPFECSNGRICTSIGITEKSVIDARNRLKQLGFIEFESGVTKSRSPRYYLIEYWNTVSNAGGIPVSIPVSIGGGNEVYTSTKQNQTETFSKSHSGGVPPAKKKKKKLPDEKTEYWKELVKVWFDFYGDHIKDDQQLPAKPVFNGVQGEHLSKIISHLKKLSDRKNYNWSEPYACKCLSGFLEKAWTHDEWFKNNFELSNMLQKFNSIINKNANGTATNRTNFKKISATTNYEGGI